MMPLAWSQSALTENRPSGWIFGALQIEATLRNLEIEGMRKGKVETGNMMAMPSRDATFDVIE
jgi:hypothetical protein